MSSQSTPVILGPRFGADRDEPGGSDLQQTIAKVVAILRQRRWLFILPLLTGCLVSLAASFVLPRRYHLSALFERRDDVVITKLVTENSPYSFSTLRQSLSINLTGYNALSEAVDELGLTAGLPRDAAGDLTPEGRAAKQSLINGLARQLEVGLLEKSSFLDLIEVRYKGDRPDLGVKLVTQLKDNYMRNTRRWIGDILVKARDFFQQEVTRRSERAAQMEAELLEITVKHPGVDPADPDVLHQRLMNESLAIDDLNRRRLEAQSDIAAREDYLRELDDMAHGGAGPTTRPSALTPALVRNPQWQRLNQEIENVRNQIADARSLRKMTDQHPFVVGLTGKMRQLEEQLAAQPETLLPQTLPGNEPQAASPLDAERRRLNMELRSLREITTQIDRELPRHAAEKARLEEEKGGLFERRQNFMMRQQELQALKNDLNVWTQHLETISRVLAAEAEDRGIRFTTVEDARRPGKPASPTLGGIFALSGGVGLALAVAAVFLRELLDRSFRNAARVRDALGIPILETIGEIRVGPSPRLWSARRILPLVAGIQALAVLCMGALVYVSVEYPSVFERLASRSGLMLNGS